MKLSKYVYYNETERMGINIIGITDTHWTSDILTIRDNKLLTYHHTPPPPRLDGI